MGEGIEVMFNYIEGEKYLPEYSMGVFPFIVLRVRGYGLINKYWVLSRTRILNFYAMMTISMILNT